MEMPQPRAQRRWLWWGIAVVVIILLLVAGLHLLSGLDLSSLHGG